MSLPSKTTFPCQWVDEVGRGTHAHNPTIHCITYDISNQIIYLAGNMNPYILYFVEIASLGAPTTGVQLPIRPWVIADSQSLLLGISVETHSIWFDNHYEGNSMYLSYTNTLNKTNHFAIIDHMSSSAVTTTEETPSVTTTLMEHVAHSFFYEKINNFLYIASSTIQRFHLETRKWIPLVVNISTIDEPEDGVATGSTIYAMWYDVSTK